MVAGVGRGLHRLAPLLDPLHRPAQSHRENAERDVFRIEHRLHAEAAAHVGRDDADAILGQAEHLAQQMANEVRHLRGRPQRELLLPTLQSAMPPRPSSGAAHCPVRPERPLDHRGRPGQRRLDVAALEAAREESIRGSGLVNGRGAGACGLQHVDGRGQGLVVDADQGRRVLDPRAIGADHGGHRLARVARRARRGSAARSRRSRGAPSGRGCAGSRNPGRGR
jgi:hypothetical protein